MTITGKQSRELLAAFGRLQLAAGTEVAEDRQAAIVETLRERYTDAQICQAIDELRYTWKPQYGQGLAVCDLVEVIEGRADTAGKLLTYQQMLDDFNKSAGGTPGTRALHELYELVDIDGGPKWRKR